MKHKWHDEIVAWAGGAEIEVYKNGNWYGTDYPNWDSTIEYRIKPINIPQTSQQIVKEMTKRFEEELREKEKAFREAIEEVKVKHQFIEKPQLKQKKYLHFILQPNGSILLRTQPVLCGGEEYFGKIEVQDV